MISTVLIVEDETILCIALQSMLKSFGLEIVGTARTGKDAVEKTYSCNPDLIVMDINLADEKTGVEAAEEIRQFCQSPIVFQSATQEQDILQKAQQVEHSTFLPKTLSKLDWMDAISPFWHQRLGAA